MARRTPTAVRTPKPTAAGRCRNFLARTALELKLWIVAGSVPIAGAADGRLAQSCPGLWRRRRAQGAL